LANGVPHSYVYLFVPIETQVIILRYEVSLWHAEALGGAWTLALALVALFPSRQYIRQIEFLGVFFRRERGPGNWA